MGTRPNILLIIADHQAYHGHRRLGESALTLPRFERLASQGTRFSRAYSVCPICSPARASMMTGVYPSRHGLRWNNEGRRHDNLSDFRPDQRLYSHYLSEAGYRNAYVGKWHCGHEKVPTDYGIEGWSHCQHSKGPMMYEEITNIPFIIKAPGFPQGVATQSVASHLDLLPTMLDLAGVARPGLLHGVSLLPTLQNPQASARDLAMLSFTRFEINNDGWGQFYPIRCVTDGRHKLSVNLFETDEFYDLATDPCEVRNLLNETHDETISARLHDALLLEMDRTSDPFRSFRWGARHWRTVRTPTYHAGGVTRPISERFPFQPRGLAW